MKKYLQFFILVLLMATLTVNCTKKGTAIIEPRVGNYSFSTFTVDTLRFKIILNDVTLTDSLLSPLGSFAKDISFFDTVQRLQIIDAKNNNQLILDTLIKMQIGNNNFSIVQFNTGQKPYIPAPPANEPPPATGNYKVRFLYLTSVPGSPVPNNPIKCAFVNTSTNIGDTVILTIGATTKFYEARSFDNIRPFILNYPVNNSPIFRSSGRIALLNLSGFNTVVIRGNNIPPTPPNILNYDIIKAY